jgi:eukaryotic-like serine/threonine-protein kinase
VSSQPVTTSESYRLGENLELDARAYELRRSGEPLKLERIPMELLLLLVEQRGQLVTRDQILARIWGQNVFIEADNSINAAIRKIRQVLKDDPEHPRFVQTITGKGYRFIAPVEVGTGTSSKSASPETAPAETLIGKKVSHYRVLRLLGGGGMGVIYEAEDLKLGRRVAMKFLPAELATDSMAFDRLQREARAASSLDHPSICSIYELNEHEGQPFIVMQLLEGQTLREWIEKATDQASPSCLNELIKLSVQICSGLQAAHEKGIIHRDIKPANIFVTSRGEAKILDFGVAKFQDTSAAPNAVEPAGSEGQTTQRDPHATATEAALGTPFYLSPEQVRREKLDGRTDLFSLGLVLYEMATGQRAFSGKTATAIRDAVVHVPALPPRQLTPGLPQELERIILKAMEKDRGLRYQTASEIEGDLVKLATQVGVPSQPTKLPAAKAVTVSGVRYRSWKVAIPALLLLIGGVVGAYFYRSAQAARITDKDSIVIADFANSTGDTIFDDALKQGLSTALHQSPYLNILSDDKVGTNLKLMTRPANTVLTPDLAREVCQRTGSKAYIAGAIALLGTDYVLGLKAVNCRTGDTLAQEQVTAPSKERVIAALGEASRTLRAELGESLSTVQQYDVPLEQATTSSLEALKAYSLGKREALAASYLSAIPFYKRAIELDPNFAMAYARMGQAYANSTQNELAVQSVKQAFERRDRASEAEKFYIATRYYQLVNKDIEKRIEILQVWKRMYPREPAAHNDLGSEYTDIGKFSEALSEGQATVELEPNAHTAYEILGVAYLGLNRFEDAKATRQKEIALKIDYHWSHVDLYGIAFFENDAAGMQRELDWSKDNKYDFFMQGTRAQLEASIGKLQTAREASSLAIEKAQEAGFADVAKSMAVDADLMELMVGNPLRMSAATRGAAAKVGNQHGLISAGRIYAITGEARHANSIADELIKRTPTGTYVSRVWAPSILAQLEISRGNPQRALDLLQAAAPYEFGCKAQNWPNYVRGLAFLRAGRSQEAAAEFEKILAHRGVTLSGSVAPLAYSLSHLQLARARVMTGDINGAKTAYKDFLTLWKDADADVPMLKQAKAELAKLH